MRTAVALATCAASIVVAVAACTLPSSAPADKASPHGSGAPATGSGQTSPKEQSIARVAAGLVDVVGQLGSGAAAAGTGIVLTPDGEVLTNNHVISGSTKVTAVDVGNGVAYSASVIGYDRTHDLALLKLSGASGLPTVALDTGNQVSIGDSVTALGNAGGRGGSPVAATGTVTGLDQQVLSVNEVTGGSEQLTGLIKVDAPIQAGDSGGPLIDAGGHVIGINTADSQGYHLQSAAAAGFAIPAAEAQATVSAIDAGRASSTVHIGPTAWLGAGYAAGMTTTGQPGAQVTQVLHGSPAETLGLTAGDVITSVNGVPIADATSLTSLLDLHHPGDTVRVGWTDRSGTAHTGSVSLGSGAAG